MKKLFTCCSNIRFLEWICSNCLTQINKCKGGEFGWTAR